MSKANISLLGKNNLNNYLKLRCLYKNEFLVSYFTVGQSIFLMFRRMLVIICHLEQKRVKFTSSVKRKILQNEFYPDPHSHWDDTEVNRSATCIINFSFDE